MKRKDITTIEALVNSFAWLITSVAVLFLCLAIFTAVCKGTPFKTEFSNDNIAVSAKVESNIKNEKSDVSQTPPMDKK